MHIVKIKFLIYQIVKRRIERRIDLSNSNSQTWTEELLWLIDTEVCKEGQADSNAVDSSSQSPQHFEPQILLLHLFALISLRFFDENNSNKSSDYRYCRYKNCSGNGDSINSRREKLEDSWILNEGLQVRAIAEKWQHQVEWRALKKYVFYCSSLVWIRTNMRTQTV